jgi:hypothetical protein
VAGPDDASDIPEARTIGRTKNALRRVERIVMRSPLLPTERTWSSEYNENEGIIDDKQVQNFSFAKISQTRYPLVLVQRRQVSGRDPSKNNLTV